MTNINDIKKRIRKVATIENARAWQAESDQFIFCLDLIEISAHDRFAERRVADLEERFENLLDQLNPENKFANLHMYTDVEPYEIVRRVSDKTIELRPMKSERMDDPEIVPGGFSGHCTNNRSIRYRCTPNPDAQVIRARLRKDGKYHSARGRHIVTDHPVKFYDYNF